MNNCSKILISAGHSSGSFASNHSKAGLIGHLLFQPDTGHLLGTAGLPTGGTSTMVGSTCSKA